MRVAIRHIVCSRHTQRKPSVPHGLHIDRVGLLLLFIDTQLLLIVCLSLPFLVETPFFLFGLAFLPFQGLGLSFLLLLLPFRLLAQASFLGAPLLLGLFPLQFLLD